MNGGGRGGRAARGRVSRSPKSGCRAGRAASRGRRRTGHVAGVGSRSRTPAVRGTPHGAGFQTPSAAKCGGRGVVGRARSGDGAPASHTGSQIEVLNLRPNERVHNTPAGSRQAASHPEVNT